MFQTLYAPNFREKVDLMKNVSSEKSNNLMHEEKLVPFPHRFLHCLSCPPSCTTDLDLQDSQQSLKIHKDPEVL